jgi:hypothetical protein
MAKGNWQKEFEGHLPMVAVLRSVMRATNCHHTSYSWHRWNDKAAKKRMSTNRPFPDLYTIFAFLGTAAFNSAVFNRSLNA